MRVKKKDDDYFIEWGEGKDRMSLKLEWPRRRGVGTKNDLLKKAIGPIKPPATVIDGTGGLLRDAHHFADLGFSVIVYEREPLLAAALKKALKNDKIELIEDDFLSNERVQEKAVIVYLDPMFPESKRTALSGKETQLLKAICPLPSLEDEEKLLSRANALASRRVIVKRHLRAPPLAKVEPQHSVTGSSVRYDIYIA
jgi:16S rRNA (guanine1516-N2)-methyltransferase